MQSLSLQTAASVPPQVTSRTIWSGIFIAQMASMIVQETPPAPPPLPKDVLSVCLLKYLKAQHTFVNSLEIPRGLDPAHPGAAVPAVEQPRHIAPWALWPAQRLWQTRASISRRR